MSTSTEEIDYDCSLGPWLGRTVKLMDICLQEAFDRHGLDITKEQMIILKKLQMYDGINQNELADLTFRDKSSLTRLLTKMEGKGYILRSRSKNDKRNKNIFLTEEGVMLFNKTRPIIYQLMSAMEENIVSEEKKQVINVLKRIEHNFKNIKTNKPK